MLIYLSRPSSSRAFSHYFQANHSRPATVSQISSSTTPLLPLSFCCSFCSRCVYCIFRQPDEEGCPFSSHSHSFGPFKHNLSAHEFVVSLMSVISLTDWVLEDYSVFTMQGKEIIDTNVTLASLNFREVQFLSKDQAGLISLMQKTSSFRQQE